MKQAVLNIDNTLFLTEDIFLLSLRGDVSDVTAPGEFVNIEIPGFFLRRPISVSQKRGDIIDLIIKIAGDGTRALSTLPKETKLNVLTGLGNGFNLPLSGDSPLIVSGGVGIAPMIWLAHKLLAMGKKPKALLGFGKKAEAGALSSLIPDGVSTVIATADKSLGIGGNVCDAYLEAFKGDENDYSYFFVSGPLSMIKAMYPLLRGDGEFSLEERMGCGFGACMGCSINTAQGPKRVCSDGPVFKKEELGWKD